MVVRKFYEKLDEKIKEFTTELTEGTERRLINRKSLLVEL